MFRDQSRELRQKAQQELIGNRAEAGKAFINEAAALEQADELLARKDDKAENEDARTGPARAAAATAAHEGPSVTYHLRSRLTVPSRNDQQLIEVARIETKPEYYYKAVPVLTSHVYRLADLINKSEYVLLPGEATMYVGSDFVGRMNLPLVAIGERYTVGFGVDPQLQVSRLLVKKSRTVQGGNQVHNYDYRITVGELQVGGGEGAGLGPPAPGRGRGGRRQPGRAVAEAQRGPDLPAPRAARRTCSGGTSRSSRARPARRRRRSPTSSSWSTPATWPSPTSRPIDPAPKHSEDPTYLRRERPEYLLRRYLRVAATGSRSEQRPAQSRCETPAIFNRPRPEVKGNGASRYSVRDPNRNDGRKNIEKSTMHLSCDRPTKHCSNAQG